MKISLKSIIDTDKDYYIKNAIYSKKLNKLKLIIVGEKEKEIEEKLEKYFSYVNLAIKYEDIKNDKPQVNPIEEFYENQPLPDFYETGYEDEGEEIVEDKKEEIQEKNSNNEDKDIFDLPKLEEKKDENITEEKPSSLRDLKKLELENMIQNARNNKKNSEKVQKEPSDILKYGRIIKADEFKIEEIYDKKGMNLSLRGRVFGIDIFESKRGNFIYSFDL
ncbi:MAG: DNA-binding protein, partial [Anaerococcus sp.]|nr:DNA-binding protein [Anaerococcus sp.]